MNYYDNLHFSFCGSVPESRDTIRHTPIYYGIQYNHRGAMFLRINHGKTCEAEGPCAFLTHPDAFFEYGPTDKVRHHNHVCVFGKRIETLIQCGLFDLHRDPPLVRIGNPEKFLATLQALIRMIQSTPVPPPRAVLLFEDLLLQMHESSQAGKKLPPFQTEFLQDLIERIRSSPELEWDFTREAEACHVTLIHFRRLFKELAGLPPLQFHIQCRLGYAADLLVSTRYSVSEIAEKTGFGNPFYFSRLFKEKYWTSPLAYRREYVGIR